MIQARLRTQYEKNILNKSSLKKINASTLLVYNFYLHYNDHPPVSCLYY